MQNSPKFLEQFSKKKLRKKEVGSKLIICQSPTVEKLFFCLNPKMCLFTNWIFLM